MIKASSQCPICGVDTPHEHDGLTVKQYRDDELYFGKKKLAEYEAIVARRKAIDDKIRAALQERIDAALKSKSAYEAACPCCRIARVGDEMLKDVVGTLIVYDYGWEVSNGGDIVRCPECGTCLWDES